MKIRAPGKLNLTLEVLKQRKDGYHEVRSILQTIGLYDELELEESQALEFVCDISTLNNENNIAIKAFNLLREKTGTSRGARIRINKFIPVAAGLGGGSSDAAAVLKSLNVLWHLNLPAEELMKIASELGSDVPFFLQGGTALARGRGEIIESLPPLGEYWFVLLIPPMQTYADKTARMYRGLTKENYSQGDFTQSLARRIKEKGEIEPSLLYNVFDKVALKIYPKLAFFQELLAEVSGTHVHLAGSGPCLYAIFKEESKARQTWSKLKEKNYISYIAKTLTRII